MRKTELILQRAEAAKRLDVQIQQGRQLAESPTRTDDLGTKTIRQDDALKWHDYNIELLGRLFTTDDIRDYYASAGFGPVRMFNRYPDKSSEFAARTRDLVKTVQNRVTALESLAGRLELIPERAELAAHDSATPESKDAGTVPVFIVHGHDHLMKERVARLLSDIPHIRPIILHEQPNQGRTIIEKFEHSAHQSGFAVVLFSADDYCAPRAEAPATSALKSRPRQNVVFELGFFAGSLGRSKVAVLYREGVEILSDYQGVAYIPFDDGDSWKIALAKELRAAGIECDLNKLL